MAQCASCKAMQTAYLDTAGALGGIVSKVSLGSADPNSFTHGNAISAAHYGAVSMADAVIIGGKPIDKGELRAAVNSLDPIAGLIQEMISECHDRAAKYASCTCDADKSEGKNKRGIHV